MKQTFYLMLYLLSTSLCQSQHPAEVLLGGDFFSNFLTNDSEEYGRTHHLDLRLGLSRGRSFNPPFRYSYIPKRSLSDSSARVNSFFYGGRISFISDLDNWGIIKTRYYAIGSEAFLRYYTPINILFETSLGLSYGWNKAWEIGQLHKNIWYVPKVSDIIYTLSFSLGYSLQLKGSVTIEPRIYYSLIRDNLYYQQEHNRTYYNSSINFRIAIFFVKKQTQ